MAGYLGPKAIQYNVDNSNVTNDSNVGGDLTVGGELNATNGILLGSSTDALDDYETGTFTAVAGFEITNPTLGATTSTGYYTKIGDKVFVEVYLSRINVTGASGQCEVSGLPFTLADNGILPLGGIRMRSVTFVDQVICMGIPNTTKILLEDNLGSYYNNGIAAKDCDDGGTDIAISINYTV